MNVLQLQSASHSTGAGHKFTDFMSINSKLGLTSSLGGINCIAQKTLVKNKILQEIYLDVELLKVWIYS